MSETYKETEEFEQKVNSNIWELNLDKVVSAIKELRSENSKWSWARNMRCKYITLRIDMRDGGFIITDRDGNRISIEAVKWQYKGDDE